MAAIPTDARTGFWVAIGVLAGMLVFHFVTSKIGV